MIDRGGRRRTGGFTLVDVVIALAVMVVAVLGIISLLLALQSRNESFNTSRHAVRACQEVMELAITEMQVLPLSVWVDKWGKATFVPRKVFILDKKDRAEKGPAGGTRKLHYAGTVSVRDVSEPEQPESLFEIAVAVDTTGLTSEPIKTSLVTRRSRP
jgi:type II secretory pathway pseudopilin PulG